MRGHVEYSELRNYTQTNGQTIGYNGITHGQIERLLDVMELHTDKRTDYRTPSLYRFYPCSLARRSEGHISKGCVWKDI